MILLGEICELLSLPFTIKSKNGKDLRIADIKEIPKEILTYNIVHIGSESSLLVLEIEPTKTKLSLEELGYSFEAGV